jgi:hypothetical protein
LALSVSAANSENPTPVASSTLARLSVEGQRGRASASADIRFERLKLVGSRPAILAMADGLMSKRFASASIAVQISVCERAVMA